jgi:NADH-quinone oxidoreductase subunit E
VIELVVARSGSKAEGVRRTFSPASMARLEATLKKYPTKQAALLPTLWIAQEEFGWVSKETVEYVSELLGLTPAFVDGVVTFYTMYNREPVGRTLLQVCTSISCHICGSRDLLKLCEKKLGIRVGETTPDGEFTLQEVECIAACDGGPALIAGEDYVLKVDEASLDRLIAARRGAGKRG